MGPIAHPDVTIHEIERVRLQQALSVVPIDSRARLTEGLLGRLLADRDWPTLRDDVDRLGRQRLQHHEGSEPAYRPSQYVDLPA
jgi:hypothetical protein